MKKVFSRIAALNLGAGLLASFALAQAPAPPVPETPQPAPALPAPGAPVLTNTPAAAAEPKVETPKTASKTAKKKTPAKKIAAPKKKDSAPAQAEAPAPNPIPATVKGDRVNVRGQASLVGEVVTQLKKGERITILDEIAVKNPKANEPAAWAKIAMPSNVPVWVSSGFLDPATKTVKSARLNVRAGPGENFSIIGRLKQGDTVKEIRQVDDWTEIETPPGIFGFVAMDLLQKETDAVVVAAVAPTTPAPEPPPAPVPAPPEPAKPEQKKMEVAKADPAPATPAAAEPAPSTPAVPQDPAVAPLVLPPAPPIEPPKPIKRVVRREGVVCTTLSIQAPSPYGLADPYDNRLINYLISNIESVTLRHLKGSHVVVTGEEYVDPRWPRMPILKVDTLEVAP